MSQQHAIDPVHPTAMRLHMIAREWPYQRRRADAAEARIDARSFAREKRNESIIGVIRSGKSISEAARIHSVSKASVYSVIRPFISSQKNYSHVASPTSEEWRAIEGYEGKYEISNLGRIKSLPRINRRGRATTGGILVAKGANKVGSNLTIILSNPRREFKVHRLVLNAFLGKCPNGMEGCHNDGNKCNNRIDNLRWDTRSSNISDAYAHGAKFRRKLTFEQIVEVRNSLGLHREIAKRFGITRATVSQIKSGRSWPNVEALITQRDELSEHDSNGQG
jgi:transposase-like protein/DNA-binding XRE family transcriptional regulator